MAARCRMSLIKECLQKLGIGKRDKTLTLLDAEALRTAFQTRYHNFKLLLSANNKALQIMSELRGGPQRRHAVRNVLYSG